MDKEIVISTKAILVAFLIGLVFYIVYRLGPILGLFATALMIVFAMEPFVKRLMKGTFMNKSVPRSLAVAVAYTILISVLALIITLWLPPFVNESQKLVRSLPGIIGSVQLTEAVELNLSDFLPQASELSGNFISAIVSLFSNITALFSIFIMAIYMSLDWPNLKTRFSSLFPAKAEDLLFDALEEIELNLGHWVKGEAVLMFVVGLLSFLGLLILDVDYPLALGLISGLLEIVPMIGPIISAILAAIIALADSPLKAIGVIVLFTIIQQLENNILVPQVMKKVSGFSPLIILFALLVGTEFFGMLGAILAVPAAMTLGIVVKKIFKFMR